MEPVPDGTTARPSSAPPSARERDRRDRELFRRLRDEGDQTARAELVERFMGLARSIAFTCRTPYEAPEDLLQVASLALVKAIDRFDPDRGTSFSTYAVPTILGEIKRHLRDRSWSVRPPRDLQEMVLRVERTSEDLSLTLGRAPSVPELAADMGLAAEEILEALQARQGRVATSFDTPIRDRDDARALGERLITASADHERAEDRATLSTLLPLLSAREREVLRLRFEHDLTQTEIGAMIGVSQMQVSRILHAAIDRLSSIVADDRRGGPGA